MKRLVQIISIVLVLACVFALFSTTALAATSVSGTNKVVTVVTGKKVILNPTVKVKNTGSTKMTIVVDGYKTIGSLAPGKTTTITLKANSTYTIRWSGTATAGYGSAKGTITAGRFITSIY